MVANNFQILSTGLIGEGLIRQAAKEGFCVDELPFIKIVEAISDESKEKLQKLLHENAVIVFTSKNAVEIAGKWVKGKVSWKIFCIGYFTESRVKEVFGKGSIRGSAENASLLAEKILTDRGLQKVVFFCGNVRRDELPGKLKENGIEVEEIELYKTIETPSTLTKYYDGILFFSPSAVKSFFTKNKLSNQVILFAIGETTANEVRNFTKRPVFISESPDKRNLLKMAISHFKKKY